MRFPYHCGILVFDLDEALGRFESGLGLAFREPESRALSPAPGSEGALPAGAEVRFAFSVGRTFPYVELIEAQEEGLFGRQHGEGVHHVGFWVDDMAAVRAEQQAAGLEAEASFADPDGVERVFYAAGGPVRVESVNGRLRDEYEAWLAGGRARVA